MLCRLTHAQFRQVEMRMPELYATAMREHRVTRGRTQHDYDMPAIAWRQILDEMMRVCFGPAGGKLKGRGRPADSAYLAIRRIGDTVRRIEGHPALAGRWVEGWVGDVIPAWGLDHYWNGGYSPYPPQRQVMEIGEALGVQSIERRFVLLLPTHEMNLGMKVTRWEPDQNPMHWEHLGSWTWNADTHLLFSRSPTAA